MKLFTCEFNRMSDELLSKEYETVRLGDPNVDHHNLSKLYKAYCKDFKEKKFDPDKDSILLLGHFKRVSCMLAAVKRTFPNQKILVTHYNTRSSEFLEEWM